MESKNNKIIAMSGEPVSGKGTVIKCLCNMLKEQGYSSEDIHIVSTGKKFRDFFENVIEIIKNVHDDEKLKELARDEHIQKVVRKKEYRDVLQKLITEVQSQNIDIDNISKISDLNSNEMFNGIRTVIDTIIDNETKQIGSQIDKEKKECWIFDSRLAFYNVPEAFSVRLTANPKEAGKRLFNDKTRGDEDKYATIEEATKEREERRVAEVERYKELYNVNLDNEENYDLIIDTSYADVKDIANVILQCEEEHKKDKYFGKTWASPLTMIPCQNIRDTMGKQFSDWDLIELGEEIKQNGYKVNEPIEIYKIDGINYILEGHHRTFASIYAGKTLIPYVDLMTTELGQKNFKTGTVPTTNTTQLYDHEDLAEQYLRKVKGDDTFNFSYAKLCDNLLEKIQRKTKNDREI